jgi:type II secretion system protein H
MRPLRRNPEGRGFPGDLLCRAARPWGLPWASRRFAHLIPESRRRGHAWPVQRLLGGFTLAEILVVLIVIGIAAGLAYAQLDRDPRQALEREGRRFAGALEHAALLAQWKNQTLGVSASGGAYRFWRRVSDGDGERWLALSDDAVLLPRTLPSPLIAAPQAYAGQPVPGEAVLPLVPSGRNEPYVIALASSEWQLLLTADPLNRVALIGPVPR